MFGQSYFIKKVAKKVIREIAEVLGASPSQARKIAKELALKGSILTAILTVDFIGLKASIAEEMVDAGIDVNDIDIDEGSLKSNTANSMDKASSDGVRFGTGCSCGYTPNTCGKGWACDWQHYD